MGIGSDFPDQCYYSYSILIPFITLIPRVNALCLNEENIYADLFYKMSLDKNYVYITTDKFVVYKLG